MREFNCRLSAQAVTIVNSTNTAVSVKSGSLPVFATPMMISLMEQATCEACAPLLESGETTVGTKIDVSHDKATPTGVAVTAFAQLEQVDGRRLVFSVYAKDADGGVIGKGTIERFVVISDKFMKKVNK